MFVAGAANRPRLALLLLATGAAARRRVPPAPGEHRRVARKKRCTFTIETELLERLRGYKARTGLSESEQIRQALRAWLDAREWPAKGFRKTNKIVDRGP
jgi:hypothetical protein